jgi:hypothetical protein
MTALNPAKKYLYRELKNFLNKSKKLKNIGVDAACENLKNAKFFPVKKYIGIDIRERIIKKGLRQNKGSKYLGLKYDLTNKNILGNNFADIVVCTNTLYQISNNKKKRVIDTLINFVKDKGQILIQVNKNDPINTYIKSQLKKKFKVSYKKNYDNFISKNYSKFFENRFNKKIYSIYLFLNSIKFNFILSLFEFIFQNFYTLNNKIIYFGENKKKNFKKSKLRIEINKNNFVRLN